MPKLLRTVANQVERALNVHLFKRSSASHFPEANFERILFERLGIDCVFDVGANTGQYAFCLRRFTGFRGLIFSFEPNPAPFAVMEAAAHDDPLWFTFPFALGAETRRDELNVMRGDTLSSFLAPKTDPSTFFTKNNRVVSTLDVEIRTLEDVFAELNAQQPFSRPFLKLDTQGFDLEVVRGGGTSLGNFHGALSELSFVPIYEDQPSAVDALAAFEAAGFSPVDMFNVHSSDHLAAIVECNCYFVRKDLTTAQP